MIGEVHNTKTHLLSGLCSLHKVVFYNPTIRGQQSILITSSTAQRKDTRPEVQEPRVVHPELCR